MLSADVAIDHAAFDLFDAGLFARGVDVLDDIDIDEATCGLRADCTLRYPFNNGYRSVFNGRFTSPDPLHMQTQLSHLGPAVYTYAANRPQMYQDSDGRFPEEFYNRDRSAEIAELGDMSFADYNHAGGFDDGWEDLRCMAECLEATDPLGPAGDALAGAAGPIPKPWVAPFGVRTTRVAGASYFTTIASAISQKLGLGARNSLRRAGRVGSAAAVGYGVGLAGLEAACAIECGTRDKCEQ